MAKVTFSLSTGRDIILETWEYMEMRDMMQAKGIDSNLLRGLSPMLFINPCTCVVECAFVKDK
jgi:hypothetical protein